MRSGDVVDGRFRLVEQVGVGGMGVVFRAIDQAIADPRGATVALKLLEGRTGTEIERAHREAVVLARLSHPAIVRHVADGVLADGKLYLAMEWIEGRTVSQRIAGDGFTLRDALAVVRRVADGLASAHGAGVLHRDLKPSNILLEADDPARAKLIDFGIARLRDAVNALTRTGAAIGTPGYMSPEQARGDQAITPASDVFGLGCVLYECATGVPAFSGTAAAAVMAKILLAEPAPFGAGCPEAPRAVVALVERMLAKDARRRLPDCGAVVAQIDALGDPPAGPRRSSRRLTSDATRIAPAQRHVVVVAATGSPDDLQDPPAPAELELLATAVATWQARLEVLASGAVMAHVTGDAPDVAHRAARLGLAMRRILVGWSIAISTVADDVGQAAEHGTELATRHAVAALFGAAPADGIAIDPSTAELLADLADELAITVTEAGATLTGTE